MPTRQDRNPTIVSPVASILEFTLNGRIQVLTSDQVRAALANLNAPTLRPHWVDIDGHRWPPKDAFRKATGLSGEPFTSHFALRLFQRLGFPTSTIPTPARSPSDAATADGDSAVVLLSDDALDAFRILDAFMAANGLTRTLTALEASLNGANGKQAMQIAADSGFNEDLVDSAMVVRERVGMLDTLIHAAVITQVLPKILEEGETLVMRPSLGAGNDPSRRFDLETNLRVAEFKLSSWKGRDSQRQRGLFADVVGLSLDGTGRRREMYVVGALPVNFLTTSNGDAAKKLSKAALHLRNPDGLLAGMSVSKFTREAGIEVINLQTLIPGLR